ncbi:MAG: hypothetical protein JXA35_02240 [Deltaproteobacteria bacterium]|nr:hypothetical protein [Deltaproteobacteria bacterium]
MIEKYSNKKEDGSVAVVTLLLLLALTLIGITAITNSTIDMQIAANDREYKTALHNADSGAFAVPKVISLAIDDKETPGDISGNAEEKRYDAFTYMDLGTDDNDGSNPTFYRELAGFDNHDDDPDIEFALNENNISVDIQRLGASQIGGGGAEFLSGYEGVGAGSSGGIGIRFLLDSFGTAQRDTRSNVGVAYRKVIGIAGGL